jgi:hypothetical protein
VLIRSGVFGVRGELRRADSRIRVTEHTPTGTRVRFGWVRVRVRTSATSCCGELRESRGPKSPHELPQRNGCERVDGVAAEYRHANADATRASRVALVLATRGCGVVGVAELPLDGDERHAFVSHLDPGERAGSWWGAKRRVRPASAAARCSCFLAAEASERRRSLQHTHERPIGKSARISSRGPSAPTPSDPSALTYSSAR